MHSEPLVSVLIPAYNHERYVADTLDSVKNQSYRNMEVIVLNDGSSDGTAEIIRGFVEANPAQFKRLLFVDKKNEGITRTLNQGLQLAEGEFIFIIASDDQLADPGAIEKLVRIITASDSIGMACGDAHFISPSGELIEKVRNSHSTGSFVRFNFPQSFGLDVDTDFGSYKSLLLGNYIPGGVLIRKSVYDRIGTYDPGKILEDYGFWLSLSKQYRIVLHPEVLLNYRVHETNTVSVNQKKIQLEVADLILAERAFARNNGYAKYWRAGAVTAGLHILATFNRNGISRMLKLLLMSIPAWPNELSKMLKRRYHRLHSKT